VRLTRIKRNLKGEENINKNVIRRRPEVWALHKKIDLSQQGAGRSGKPMYSSSENGHGASPCASTPLILLIMYEHGEPWWNDINRGKLLICLPELSAILQEANQEEHDK
jgi:hypothetical protein